jgi:urea carboxylase-associated protein 1
MPHAVPSPSQPDFGNLAVTSDEIVGPGRYWLRRIPRDGLLRIVDLEGLQAVDFLCFDAADLSNRYNAANTLKLARNIYLTAGSVLYSDLATPLMTIVADTVGRHDTIAGCCSKEMNKLRYGVENTPNCRDNFISALAQIDRDARDIPANVNFFMNVPVAERGTVTIADGLSRPGDHIDLRCETDVLAVASNCPQRFNPSSGGNPSPIRMIVWEPRRGQTS